MVENTIPWPKKKNYKNLLREIVYTTVKNNLAVSNGHEALRARAILLIFHQVKKHTAVLLITL